MCYFADISRVSQRFLTELSQYPLTDSSEFPGSIHRKSGLPCINLEIADLESPDFIFEKIIQVVGEDPVEIELGHDIVLDLYEKETLSKGTYTMPRWKAIPALLIEKKNMQT